MPVTLTVYEPSAFLVTRASCGSARRESARCRRPARDARPPMQPAGTARATAARTAGSRDRLISMSEYQSPRSASKPIAWPATLRPGSTPACVADGAREPRHRRARRRIARGERVAPVTRRRRHTPRRGIDDHTEQLAVPAPEPTALRPDPQDRSGAHALGVGRRHGLGHRRRGYDLAHLQAASVARDAGTTNGIGAPAAFGRHRLTGRAM